jgi:CRISPR-associated protein Cas2
MARRRYLITYDIRDDKRLRKVATCMEGYGDRMQYSVFVCDLSEQELVAMRSDVEDRMRLTEDSVMVVDLGRPDDTTKFLFIGHHDELPNDGPLIV